MVGAGIAADEGNLVSGAGLAAAGDDGFGTGFGAGREAAGGAGFEATGGVGVVSAAGLACESGATGALLCERRYSAPIRTTIKATIPTIKGVLIFKRAYSLCFLRQFGIQYDVFPFAPPAPPPTGLQPLPGMPQ